MTISKKTLDELIETYRKFWQNNIKEGSLAFQQFLEKSREVSHKLELQTNRKIWDTRFCDLVSVYVRCNATNETIYKAIELLGIEIE